MTSRGPRVINAESVDRARAIMTLLDATVGPDDQRRQLATARALLDVLEHHATRDDALAAQIFDELARVWRIISVREAG